MILLVIKVIYINSTYAIVRCVDVQCEYVRWNRRLLEALTFSFDSEVQTQVALEPSFNTSAAASLISSRLWRRLCLKGF